MSLYRNAAITRQRHQHIAAHCNILRPFSPACSREYHGDPGPSTIRHSRKKNDRRLLQNALLGKEQGLRDLAAFEALLDGPAPSSRPRGQARPPQAVAHQHPLPKVFPHKHSATSQGLNLRSPHLLRPSIMPSSSTNRQRSPPLQQGTPDPYETSRKIRTYLDTHTSPLSMAQVEEVLRIVMEVPRDAVNAPVWNMVFAMLGREKKLDRMWKAFNDMKKRAIKPTSRTYTTLLNAYASVSHSGVGPVSSTSSRPEPRTLSRVSIIHSQAQAHIKLRLPTQLSDPNDVGLELRSGQSDPQTELDEEVNIGPTNAYLKFLARYGMWKEMEKVYLDMDRTGPLAADAVTYTTMFHALRTVQAQQEREVIPAEQAIAIGPAARYLWDQVVRRTKDGGKGGFKIDGELAVLAVQCLAQGRPEDMRLVTVLIPHLWGLPALGDTSVTTTTTLSSSSPKIPSTPLLAAGEQSSLSFHITSLPTLPLTVPIATSLLSLFIRANKPTLASHYAHVFLAHPSLKRADKQFYLRAIRALSETGEASTVLNVLEKAPKEGWGMEAFGDALTAARWAVDWEAAAKIWERMTGMAPGRREERDGAKKSNLDEGKVAKRKVITYQPDPKTMSLLIKVALGKGWREILLAMDTFKAYDAHLLPPSSFSPDLGPSRKESAGGKPKTKSKKEESWRKELAKDVQRAAERLLNLEKDEVRRASFAKLAKQMEKRLGA